MGPRNGARVQVGSTRVGRVARHRGVGTGQKWGSQVAGHPVSKKATLADQMDPLPAGMYDSPCATEPQQLHAGKSRSEASALRPEAGHGPPGRQPLASQGPEATLSGLSVGTIP